MSIYLLTIYILKLIDIAVFLDASFANIHKHYLPDFFLPSTSTGYFLTQLVLHCDVLCTWFFGGYLTFILRRPCLITFIV